MGTNAKLTIKQRLENFKAMEKEDKRRWWGEFFIDNSLYIFLIAAIIGIAVYNPNFVSMKSIINIVSLSAANLPIALGIAGAIILTGTDLSAGRVVGLTACVAASLLQMAEYPNKMFPGIGTVPVPIVILAVIAIGALVGAVNGFCTAKFNLHPFIVTLATQLIVYGTLLIYLMQGNNNGQSISGLDKSYTNLITGSILSVPDGKGNMVPIPNFVWYAIVITVVMWFVWNKTTFGKNMFAVGSNPEAANVSGVNVAATTILVFTLAGVMYGFTGFIEGARIGANTANTGLNYELDAIAACVIGGVSFILYGMISAIGVRNVVENQVDFTNSRNLIIAAVILVSALGFNSVGGLTFAVAGVSINLSGLAIAAIVGILLNAILPGNDYEFDSADGADAPSSGNLQV